MPDRYRTWFPLVAERLYSVDFPTLPRAIKVFVAIIAAFEVLRWFAPSDLQRTVELLLGTNLFLGGAFVPEKLYTLFTSWAVHGSFMHTLFNTVIFIFIGQSVHRHVGTGGFVALVLLTSAAGGLAAALSAWGRTVVTIGASGAVFGLIGAGAYFLTGGATPREKLGRMAAYIAVFMVLNYLFAFVGGDAFGAGGGEIAWIAHAGGMVAGLILFPILAIRHWGKLKPPGRPPLRPV